MLFFSAHENDGFLSGPNFKQPNQINITLLKSVHQIQWKAIQIIFNIIWSLAQSIRFGMNILWMKIHEQIDFRPNFEGKNSAMIDFDDFWG